MTSEEYDELLDICGELSQKINKHYSMVREFEKQRFQPLSNEISKIFDVLDNLHDKVTECWEHIEIIETKLELLTKERETT